MRKARKAEAPRTRQPALRLPAEAQLDRLTSPAVEVQGKDPQRIVHELQVHQLELRMQNEELNRTYLELEVSRDRYLDLYEFSPVGYFTFSRQGRIMEANLTGAALLETTRNRLIGREMGSYIAPEDRARWRQHLASVGQSASSPPGQGDRNACDLKLQRKDGSVFYVRIESVRLNRADQKELTGAAVEVSIIRTAMSDISGRVRAEGALLQAHQKLELRVKERTAELREANEHLRREIEVRQLAEQQLSEAELRYRTVADFAYDWEYWRSPEGLLLYCSPSCERITGYGTAELVANPDLMAQMIHPQDRNSWQQHGCETMAEPGHRSITFRIHRKDGKMCWIDHFCQPVIGSQGEVQGVRGSNRDVTGRKDAEMEAQKLRNDLAHVGRVTAAGQLTASLAHELNQPLAAIRCNADTARRLLVADPPDVAEAREALADIADDSARAGAVIQRVRALFKRTDGDRSVLQVNDLILDTLDLLRREFVLKSVAAQAQLDPELPRVLGNRIELQQVLLNLLSNAIDALSACDPGLRHLRIATSREGAGEIRISVSDSGPGIQVESISRLFEPFFTTKADGIGIGLSISQSIIEAHGGDLQAINNPDRGATSWVILPIHNGGPS
ncbi:MAG: ATP-binding protein [Verrucomicrobiota bacterium]